MHVYSPEDNEIFCDFRRKKYLFESKDVFTIPESAWTAADATDAAGR